jgi:ribulose 1,5-bisphosphate carboxylase large subunit-like protein
VDGFSQARAGGENVIRLTYRIETAGSPEAMAAKIASDQSTGTFVALPGETEELKGLLSG